MCKKAVQASTSFLCNSVLTVTQIRIHYCRSLSLSLSLLLTITYFFPWCQPPYQLMDTWASSLTRWSAMVKLAPATHDTYSKMSANGGQSYPTERKQRVALIDTEYLTTIMQSRNKQGCVQEAGQHTTCYYSTDLPSKADLCCNSIPWTCYKQERLKDDNSTLWQCIVNFA